uniref:Rho related BTB domain containing 3 n=1 Tax=Sarcophilus harrisii TaxID=9305 RepID=A0A7N4NIW3_SARHA
MFLLSLPPSLSLSLSPFHRSIHIVALGNEGDGFPEDNRQSGLIWTYLGRSALVSETESSLLLNSDASSIAYPVFTEYQACVFGNVRLVVHDCPVWKNYRVLVHCVPQIEGTASLLLKGYNLLKN